MNQRHAGTSLAAKALVQYKRPDLLWAANYVLHGINLSSQQHTWWKALGAEVISMLQPRQSKRENYSSLICQQLADTLNENLQRIKIERANRERIES